jgi:hypothetical protein
LGGKQQLILSLADDGLAAFSAWENRCLPVSAAGKDLAGTISIKIYSDFAVPIDRRGLRKVIELLREVRAQIRGLAPRQKAKM